MNNFKKFIISKKICANNMLRLGIDIKIIRNVTSLGVKEIKRNYNKIDYWIF